MPLAAQHRALLQDYAVAVMALVAELEKADQRHDFHFVPLGIGALACWEHKLKPKVDPHTRVSELVLDHLRLNTSDSMSFYAFHKPCQESPVRVTDELKGIERDIITFSTIPVVAVAADPDTWPVYFRRVKVSTQDVSLPTGGFLLWHAMNQIAGICHHASDYGALAGGDTAEDRETRHLLLTLSGVQLFILSLQVPRHSTHMLYLDHRDWTDLISTIDTERYHEAQLFVWSQGMTRNGLARATAEHVFEALGEAASQISALGMVNEVEAAFRFCGGFFSTQQDTGFFVRPSIEFRLVGKRAHSTVYEPVSRRLAPLV
ncbi:hypothetical protein JCM10207_003341 [Rhodosporidiobolus poonsookiae]